MFCNLLVVIDLLYTSSLHGLPIASKVSSRQELRELMPNPGVQRCEDARNLTSLRARRRSPGDLEQPPGNRRRKISVLPFCGTAERWRLAEKNVEVCDVARACRSFRSNPRRESWIAKRMPGRRGCGPTHAGTPGEAACVGHFNSIARSCVDPFGADSPICENGAHRSERMDPDSSIRPCP